MNRREGFEKFWAEQNDVPVETMAQYRCEDERQYRLPKMAGRYRVWCAALDSIVVELPRLTGSEYPDCDGGFDAGIEECQIAIEAAGLKVAQ